MPNKTLVALTELSKKKYLPRTRTFGTNKLLAHILSWFVLVRGKKFLTFGQLPEKNPISPLCVLRTVGRLKAPLPLLLTVAFICATLCGIIHLHSLTLCVYLACVRFFSKSVAILQQNYLSECTIWSP
jgi:hypothetical protein